MIALDANVLIYACDKADVRRQEIALDIISKSVGGVLLWQVACEFIAASRKLADRGFTPVHAWQRLGEYLVWANTFKSFLFAFPHPISSSVPGIYTRQGNGPSGMP